jgi:hypothetical protein
LGMPYTDRHVDMKKNDKQPLGRKAMKDIPTKAAVTGDVVQLMNQLELGRFHFQLLGLCAAVVFMDGFDAQAIGYVAPSLSQAWILAPGALGPVFGAGLFGIMLGALVGGCRSEESHHLRGAFLRRMHSDHRLRHGCATTTDYPFHYRCGARGRDAERNRSDI